LEPVPVTFTFVMLFNASANKGERVGFKVLENGRKVRTFRSSGEVVDA
jgi:large subunit ribosomal protein L24